MKNRHITQILDQNNFAALGAKDLLIIDAHIASCRDCEKAFQAAQISSILLRAHSVESTFTPSPFFHARVLGAVRAKQSSINPIDAFRRWWQASALMVGLMSMMVLGLAAMTLLSSLSNSIEAQAGISNDDLYSTDTIIFNQRVAPELTTEQIFQILDDTRNSSK